MIALAIPHHLSKRPHVRESFISAHLETWLCALISILMGPQLALCYRDKTLNLTWDSSSHFYLTIACLWADCLCDRCSHQLHIFRCSYGSASSNFFCFKCATYFIQPLNSHLNSVRISNSVSFRNNESLPKSSSLCNNIFIVFKIRPQSKSLMSPEWCMKWGQWLITKSSHSSTYPYHSPSTTLSKLLSLLCHTLF